MAFAQTREQVFPDAVPLARYVERTRRALRPHGFTARNSLALLGACRDELSIELFTAVKEHWGAPFELMSLAGLPSYGRTALAAAAAHVPEGTDGTRRMVALLTTHIGIDREGVVGQCRRPGQSEPTTACGALAALRAELARGNRDTRIDPRDVEMSLLRARLTEEYPAGDVPSMEDLTRKVRDVMEADFRVVASDLLGSPDTLTAVFTGIVVHGPQGRHGQHSREWVDPGTATLYAPDGPTAIAV